MLIIRDSDKIPMIKNSVVTVGSFDGVHLGHCKILNFLKEEAIRINGASVVVTFDPHPRKIIGENNNFFTINTLNDNLKLIETQGIDIVLIQTFDKKFSQKSFQEFVSEIIIGKLNAKTIVMGPNHAMGHNREGNHNKIKEFCCDSGLNVVEIPEEMYRNSGVHSANIRKLIENERWNEVDAMLGYNYKHKTKKETLYE